MKVLVRMKNLVTISRWIVMLCFLLISVCARADDPHIVPAPPEFYAHGYLLMDYHSGKILVEQNIHQKIPINALSQLMTSYIIGQKLKSHHITLNDPVTISKQAWAVNFPHSNKMFIRVGNKVKVSDLNQGIIVDSANDASLAMAQYISGTDVNFVTLMNDWAKTLGMKNSIFTSANGLTNTPQSYTTVYDMALLARASIQDIPQQFARFKEKSFTWDRIHQFNRNGLLWDQGLNVDGLKAGQSLDGYNLISTAKEGNMRLIAIILGTPDRYSSKDDTKKLLRYGFRVFNSLEPYAAGQTVTTEKVWMGNAKTLALGVHQNSYVTIPKGQLAQLKASIKLNKALIAPITKGEVVGTLYYTLYNQPEGQAPLVALASVGKGNLFHQLSDYLILTFKGWFH